MNFADRCAIATGCLPKADYRAKLEALHAEMLAAINPQESKMQRMNRLHAEYEAARDAYDAEYELAVAALNRMQGPLEPTDVADAIRGAA